MRRTLDIRFEHCQVDEDNERDHRYDTTVTVEGIPMWTNRSNINFNGGDTLEEAEGKALTDMLWRLKRVLGDKKLS